ncbi:MAG: alpha/beta hydrolase [Sporichthyaceae bacterium]
MTDGDVLDRPAPPPDVSLAYGPLPQHVVDVRLPLLSEPASMVVVVHGGFWRKAYDRAHAGPQSVALAAAGYVVATVEYRRVGLLGSGWPATFGDVALMADSVVDLVSAAVPDRVDPARVCFVGHSAGGHLVAWLAGRHRLPSSSPWHRAAPLAAGVVPLAGVVDLTVADRLGLGGNATRNLLGGPPQRHPERWAAADPARLLPTGVRTVLVHGTADPVVPVEVARSFADAARGAGDDVVLRELPGVGHYALIDPLTTAWPHVLAAVEEALP